MLAVACAGGSDPVASPHEATLTQSDAWASLGADAQATVSQAALPFLLFPREYAATTVAMSGEHFVALAYRDAELTLSLHGTDVSHPVVREDEAAQAPPPAHSVRGEPGRMLVNEAIRSVAWREAGVEWALEVECAAPMDDPRCTEEAFILSLVERLERAPRGGAR